MVKYLTISSMFATSVNLLVLFCFQFVFCCLIMLCKCHLKCRQQLSTSVSSNTESSRQCHNSGLLPKLAISAEGDQEESLCSAGSRKDQEKAMFVSEETIQDEVEVTTPASTISSSTLSGMIETR